MKTVILFNAPPNSGKDTLGEILTRTLDGQLLMFKETLYEETAKHLNLTTEAFKGLATDRKTKESPMTDLINDRRTPRQALIHVSENVIKPKYGKSFFGDKLAEKLKDGYNIVTDGGFKEELYPVLEAADHAIVIRMAAPHCTFEGDSRDYLEEEDFLAYSNLEFIRFYNSKAGIYHDFIRLLTKLDNRGIL